MLNTKLLNKIDNDIFYLPSEEEPILSADIGFFIGGKFIWTYDCGASEASFDLLKNVVNLKVIISHFHNDHTGNMLRLNNVLDFYVGQFTFKHFNKGIIVKDDLFIEDSGLIHIFCLPNSHSKGSLAMEINEKYIFIGDASYGKHVDGHITYNAQLLLEQYKKLASVKADKCLLSHEMGAITDKDKLLAKFDKILCKRKKDEPIIVL